MLTSYKYKLSAIIKRQNTPDQVENFLLELKQNKKFSSDELIELLSFGDCCLADAIVHDKFNEDVIRAYYSVIARFIYWSPKDALQLLTVLIKNLNKEQVKKIKNKHPDILIIYRILRQLHQPSDRNAIKTINLLRANSQFIDSVFNLLNNGDFHRRELLNLEPIFDSLVEQQPRCAAQLYKICKSCEQLKTKYLFRAIRTGNINHSKVAKDGDNKEAVEQLILKEENQHNKRTWLSEAEDPQSNLGRFFHTKRALTAANIHSGCLARLHKEKVDLDICYDTERYFKSLPSHHNQSFKHFAFKHALAYNTKHCTIGGAVVLGTPAAFVGAFVLPGVLVAGAAATGEMIDDSDLEFSAGCGATITGAIPATIGAALGSVVGIATAPIKAAVTIKTRKPVYNTEELDRSLQQFCQAFIDSSSKTINPQKYDELDQVFKQIIKQYKLKRTCLFASTSSGELISVLKSKQHAHHQKLTAIIRYMTTQTKGIKFGPVNMTSNDWGFRYNNGKTLFRVVQNEIHAFTSKEVIMTSPSLKAKAQ